jgi:hypothetical protein
MADIGIVQAGYTGPVLCSRRQKVYCAPLVVMENDYFER